ncbi:MAG TPA: hypothetical protein VJ813_10000 [Vicinamibacterales bacterium]|nr:hypothetical protein [Vicinamibacterales bacterium]
MTRRLLTYASLAGALLLCAVVATGPVDVSGAALAPRRPDLVAAGGYSFDLHLGDGIFRLRIRGCDACRTAVTIEIRLPRLQRSPSAFGVRRSAFSVQRSLFVNPIPPGTYYRVRSQSA